MIKLSNKQNEVLQEAIKCEKAAIFGYAGSGKTTLLNELINEVLKNGGQYEAISFMGIASKVMSSKIKNKNGAIRTIHKSLESKVIENKFGYDETVFNRVDYSGVKLLIIDEISMVPANLLSEVLNRVNINETKVVVCGDVGQIPPIGKDNNDQLIRLLRARGFKDFYLDEIFRQEKDNPILELSYLLRHDKNVNFEKYVEVIECKFSDDEKRSIKQLYSNDYTQIITPYNKYVDKINEFMKRNEADNFTNEKILITKNHYPKNGMDLYNGEIYECLEDLGSYYKNHYGKETLFKQLILLVNEQEYTVTLPADSVKLAYCLTIDKTQGSEFENVVLVLPELYEYVGFISKNRLYTAVTRASKKLIIIKSK